MLRRISSRSTFRARRFSCRRRAFSWAGMARQCLPQITSPAPSSLNVRRQNGMQQGMRALTAYCPHAQLPAAHSIIIGIRP